MRRILFVNPPWKEQLWWDNYKMLIFITTIMIKYDAFLLKLTSYILYNYKYIYSFRKPQNKLLNPFP